MKTPQSVDSAADHEVAMRGYTAESSAMRKNRIDRGIGVPALGFIVYLLPTQKCTRIGL